jgi:uncharacterized protein YcbX
MDGRHPLGTVVRLWRYPVKALAAEPLDTARIVRAGFEGDRKSALFVSNAAHARSGKPYRGKEHNLLHTVRSADRAIELAAERDVTVAECDDGPYFDAEAVSLVLDIWLEELEAASGLALDPLRFRPNIYARAEPGLRMSEADLVGATLVAGEATLRVVAPIVRCVTPSYDVATGEHSIDIARAVAQRRGNTLGVYCSVRGTGTVSCGETIGVAGLRLGDALG